MDRVLRGRVVSGARRAAGFTELEWVKRQVRERLGFDAYPGTLNLRVESDADRAALALLRAGSGVSLEPESGHCVARCYPVLIGSGQSAAVVAPQVPGYPADLIELLAPVCLRGALGLEDGTVVEVTTLSRT